MAIRTTINRLRDDYETFNRISREISRVNLGKRRALLQQKVMIEQRIKHRTQWLKEKVSMNSIRATILVYREEGVKKYCRDFYGLTPQEVKDLLEIEFFYQGIYFTLVSLEEITIKTEWREVLENN